MKHWIPSDEETYAQLGLLLLNTQQAERAIGSLIALAYPKDAPSWEEIAALERKTLGQLTRTLKERVDIDPSFERLLDRFVEGRNLFAHNLSAQPWFNTQSEPGRDAIWNFIERYQVEETNQGFIRIENAECGVCETTPVHYSQHLLGHVSTGEFISASQCGWNRFRYSDSSKQNGPPGRSKPVG